MRGLKLIIGCFALLACSCDDRLKSLEVLNTAPTLEYYNATNVLVENITDSVRLNESGTTVYNLKLKLTDPNQNIQFLKLIDTKGDYTISYQKNEILAPASFRTDVETLILNLYPTKLGDVSATFQVTDRFGLSSKSEVKLVVFDNILPVAKFIAKRVQGNEYLLDATSSYDGDQNYDGKIVEYRFNINGSLYVSDTAQLSHVLPLGESIIELTVLDNSKAVSSVTVLKVNNNP